ncbi:helix-turn-helix domain-containing protein [Humisphaera borealis]|uniref:Helix-turn-helix transcriptional regulator n=1 Tax=Humisphaera borealis TaxID=2807512 RepID=A0A7M2WSC9_9BACT|nr:helix-turn-helix transcriptional regulator [Humisphaera borealis]QOV88435.1 helix-turn-helix transcriptional regulator [Humisphaera borealis]
MKITEKLRKASAGRNKADAGRSVGLPDTAISNYIASGSIPRADIALKLARALEIPLEWLVDDDQDWPPPTSSTQPGLSIVSDNDLLHELATRYRRDIVRFLETVEHAETIPWEVVAEELLQIPLEEGIPISLSDAAITIAGPGMDRVGLDFDLEYSVPKYAAVHHLELPGRNRKREDLDPVAILGKVRQSLLSNPFYRLVEKYMSLRAECYCEDPSVAHTRIAEFDAKRAELKDQLSKLKPRAIAGPKKQDLKASRKQRRK